MFYRTIRIIGKTLVVTVDERVKRTRPIVASGEINYCAIVREEILSEIAGLWNQGRKGAGLSLVRARQGSPGNERISI